MAKKKNKIKPGTKNTDLEGMGPAEKRPGPGNGGPPVIGEEGNNPFRNPQKPTDGGKKKKKKKKRSY